MATNTTTVYDPEKLKKTNTEASNTLATQSTQQVNKANQAPAQHQNYDYGKSIGYADRAMQTSNMGQATSVGDVKNQITKAANTLNQPTFQDSNFVGQLTGNILSSLAPVRQQQENSINQQFNASRRALDEAIAARGGSRSGNTINQLMGLEQSRNQQLAQANAGMIQNALAQALPLGQLALSEKGLLQGQQQTAANQLASLLGQQEASRQWADAFNAEQLQRQFANTFAAQQAQAGENQFGSQFNLQESQFARQLAEQIASRQAQQGLQEAELFGQRQTPADYSNMGQAQLEQTFAALSPGLRNQFASSDVFDRYAAARESGNDAEMQNILRTWLTQNAPSTQAQQTLAAQQLAAQLAQIQQENKFTEAGLTGIYGGTPTLASKQFDWTKENAANTLAAAIMASYAQGTDQFTLPPAVVEAINNIFT